jgi:putative NADPH-quinone reductase
MPAMRKGYFDRVLAPGIAFDIGADGAFKQTSWLVFGSWEWSPTYGSPWWLIA